MEISCLIIEGADDLVPGLECFQQLQVPWVKSFVRYFANFEKTPYLQKIKLLPEKYWIFASHLIHALSETSFPANKIPGSKNRS